MSPSQRERELEREREKEREQASERERVRASERTIERERNCGSLLPGIDDLDPHGSDALVEIRLAELLYLKYQPLNPHQHRPLLIYN